MASYVSFNEWTDGLAQELGHITAFMRNPTVQQTDTVGNTYYSGVQTNNDMLNS